MRGLWINTLIVGPSDTIAMSTVYELVREDSVLVDSGEGGGSEGL